MAQATRRHQIGVRHAVAALLALACMASSVAAAPFKGSCYKLEVPRGWMARPSFSSAEVLIMGPVTGANINVVVTGAQPGQTLESGARETAAGLRRLQGYKSLSHKFIMVAGARALVDEYTYDSPYNGRLRVRQVMALRGRRVIAVTCLSKESTWQRAWPAFKACLGSLRWTK